MILLVKRKANYYRRFGLDIWGLSLTSLCNSDKHFYKCWFISFFLKIYKARIERKWKRLKRYIYRIDIIEFSTRKKKFKLRWLSLRLTRLFFLTLKDHQFRQLFKKASKMTGNLGTNYCHLLECRLIQLSYRTNYTLDVFHSINLVKAGFFWINFKSINFLNAVVPVTAFITVEKRARGMIRHILNRKLELKLFLFNTPRFLFISFRLWFAILTKKPKKQDLVYPISIDIQRITGYY